MKKHFQMINILAYHITSLIPIIIIMVLVTAITGKQELDSLIECRLYAVR